MSFPLSPTNGQLAVVNGINYQYNSTTTAWSRVPQSYSRTTTSTVAPVNPTPVAGDQWYNPTTDTLYRYTFDGAASYWVDITGASSTTTVGQAQTYLGETTAYGNITPTTNAAYNLGSTSRTFANIYVANGVFGTALNYVPANAPVQVGFNINNYSQFSIQNANAGNNASTDIAAIANNGSDNDTYVDMGIVGSGYSQASYNLYNITRMYK